MKAKKSDKEIGLLLEEQQLTAKKIGERIKALRIKKGHNSYEDFAYENDISRSQFGKYERGADMRISSLVKVLRALGISISEFFGEGFDE